MRIVYIGCVQFSLLLLQELLQIPCAEVVGIVTKEESAFNADFVSLKSLAQQNHIDCFLVNERKTFDEADWIREKKPDVIYCFGWSKLLKSDILNIPLLGVIGYHPAGLPKNRGRHPIIWALVLGLTSTGSTFFFMDEEADSGDILSQEIIEIDNMDDAKSLYDKLAIIAIDQMREFTVKLSQGEYQRIPQDMTKANYWRKRTIADGFIDWRMSAKNIYNLVRGLTRPYVGASFLHEGKAYKVWKTFANIDSDTFENSEPGKILSVEGSKITVRCGEGIITLIDHEMSTLPPKGTYL